MKKKVFVVDDDEGILAALELLLTNEGYAVTACPDGDQVVKGVLEVMPSVIIMDLLLSGKDGADIVLDIKKHDSIKNIPIIMISAHPNAESRAREAGVTEFVAKPFETEHLLKTVKKYL